MGANANMGARLGRIFTAPEEVIIRAVGRLPTAAALGLAAAVYAGVGLALPLATGASTAPLIVCNIAAVLWAWVLMLALLYPLVESRVRSHLLEWTTDLRMLSASEFEWLVGEVLRRQGWDVEETGRQGSPDGNVDLRIHRGKELRLVQCKRWDSRDVGVGEVRTLAGTLLREGLSGDAGMLVTLSRFTEQATAEAAEMHMELVDGGRLLRWIQELPAAEPCPECGTPMVLNHSAHGWWYRCPRYPRCNGKRDLDGDPSRALELLRVASR